MKKRYLKIALFSLLTVAMPLGVTSCKDYDDDIDRLDNEVGALKTQIATLDQALKSCQDQAAQALDAANAAKAAGDEAKAAAEAAKAAAATAKAEAIAEAKAYAESLLANYATKDDLKNLSDRLDAIDTALDKIGGGSGTGTNYDQAIQQLQTQVKALEEYVALLEKLGLSSDEIKAATDAINVINGQIADLKDNDKDIENRLSKVESLVSSIDPSLVTMPGKLLRSMVFEPTFYYHGIEAMWAPTFAFKALDVKAVNADGDFATDAPTAAKGDSVRMTPDLVAVYNLNPSNAEMPEDIAKYSFTNTVKDMEYSRADKDVVKPNIYSKTIANGKLTVHANLTDGMIKNIQNDEKVTVLALQVTTQNGDADQVITSDYAALKAVYTQGFVLANAKLTAHQAHWSNTMKAAIDTTAAIDVAYNSEGINVSDYVQTHYSLADKKDIAWDNNANANTVKEKGFKYTYELVGYTLGDNKTSESAHAALKMEGNSCILRPQMTKDGKQQPFGSAQGEASIDRLPIVRVCLVDTVSEPDKVAAVGYIKFRIVPAQEKDETTIIDPFTFNNGYTVNCPLPEFKNSLTWWQVEERIIETLGISKQQFEEEYTPDYTNPTAWVGPQADQVQELKQFNKAGEGATVLAADKYVGHVGKTLDDKAASETNVIKWNIAGDQLYKMFYESKQTSTSVIVRFVKTTEIKKGSNHVQTVYHYVYVTLTWKPEPLNVTPQGTIADNLKIPEQWYEAWSSNHGFAEVHQNVRVPNDGDNTASLCTYVGHLLYPWYNEMKMGVSGVDAIYTGYQENSAAGATQLTKYLNFVNPGDNDMKTIKGLSGNEYNLSAGTENGKSVLYATKVGTKTPVAIAEIANNKTTYNSWGTDDPTVTYLENATAGDILNAYGHLQLAKNQTVAGKIAITAFNLCEKELPLTNNTYNVRFLRPVNLDIVKAGEMVDAHNSGSTVYLKDLLSFTDWRSDDAISLFSTHPNYYGYYGISKISVGKINKNTLALDDASVDAGSLKDLVLTTFGGNASAPKVLSSVARNMDLVFTPATGAISDSNMGQLTYYNNGENINQDFYLYVPIVVTYKWGFLLPEMEGNTMQYYLPILVKKTIGQ